MNKKRLVKIVTFIAVLMLLSGCKATNNNELISLETPFSSAVEEGFFTAILTYPLSQAINYLAQYMSVAIAIAIVATGLNVFVLALTFKSNISMQRMQQIQPEINKIQKKYEGRTDQNSQMRMSAEIQQIYQRNDINPVGSLAATFLQLPILLSMYSAVRRSYAVTNGSFFGYSLSIHPLTAIKELAWPLILVFLLMVVCQFLSIACPRFLSERRARKEADLHHRHYEKQKDPNSVMSYSMVLFIGFIMLNWPTALSLYYLIYSLINITKTVIIDNIVNKK